MNFDVAIVGGGIIGAAGANYFVTGSEKQLNAYESFLKTSWAGTRNFSGFIRATIGLY